MLHGVSAGDAAQLTALGSRIHISTGAPLFELGTEARDVFLIERGRIALTLPLRIGAGQEDVLVEERTAGQMVGWSALIPPHRFTLKASAPVDTDVLALPRAPLLELLRRAPRDRVRRDAERRVDRRPAPPGVPGDVAARDAARASRLDRRDAAANRAAGWRALPRWLAAAAMAGGARRQSAASRAQAPSRGPRRAGADERLEVPPPPFTDGHLPLLGLPRRPCPSTARAAS